MLEALQRGLAAIALVVIASPLVALPSQARTRVYLMRGLFDVSTGLDDLAGKLRKAGYAASVTSYTSESQVAATAARHYKAGIGCPVVIIGHSLGADAAMDMASDLNHHAIPVALIVTFSPASIKPVPSNVAKVVNYYQSNGPWNNPYARGRAFHGALRNVDLAKKDAIGHFNIEKQARLHREVLGLVAAVHGTCGSATAAAPTVPVTSAKAVH